MKTILCYGDSNTWGAPTTRDAPRYDEHTRWPGVLRDTLGEGYWIIEEGLPGRTTTLNDPIEGAHKNGLTYLTPCLESHVPLDLVIIMLGTNDLKARFSLSAYDIAQGAGMLVATAQQGIWGIKPDVLLVCPPPADEHALWPEMFGGAKEKSQRLAAHYERVAGELGCRWFDAGSIIESSASDGIHFEADQHLKLGQTLASIAREMLGG